MQDLGIRIVLVVAGLLSLSFGISNGFSHGWQLDIINIITIVAAIVLIVIGIFANYRWRK